MNRHQRGSIHFDRRRRAFFGRWYEDELRCNTCGKPEAKHNAEHSFEGVIRRVPKFVKLADYSDHYRRKQDVQTLLDEKLLPLNAGKVDARSTMSIAAFVQSHYLPFVNTNLKPSTHEGYRKLWEQRLNPLIGQIMVRDFKTRDAHEMLDALRQNGLGRRSLYHSKALVSGILRYAINLGVLSGGNPVGEAMIPKKVGSPKPTHAYTAEEVLAMIDVFEKEARKVEATKEAPITALTSLTFLKTKTAIALMFFAGLRPGEARGMRWEDYEDDHDNGKRSRLTVRRSIWRKHILTPKTEGSIKPLPVIEPLRSILHELRHADGNPQTGPILRGVLGRPLNLDMLARDVVVPTLIAAQIGWHGWYALRRGIGTLTSTIAKDPNAAKGLLRHGSLATTINHYVLDVPEVTLKAMEAIEQLCGNYVASRV